MARLQREGVDYIYGVVEVFREEALSKDGSVLTPGEAVWSLEALNDLRQRFNLSPDASSDSFEVKLQRQMAGASDTSIQLMAEVLLLHLLITVSIGGASKRSSIAKVTSWMSSPVTIPDNVDRALDYGLAGPGTFFNTGRDRQMKFIIEWMRTWKGLAPADRDEALKDPWAFKRQLHSVDIDAAWLQRNALLHLIHPEAFERAVSRNDKQEIIDAFADRIGGREQVGSLDEDRALLEIRQALAPEYGEDFDFYDTPEVLSQWRGVPNDEPPGDPKIPLLDRVLAAYPEWTGFSDPRFVRDESNYKRRACENANTLLGETALAELIEQSDYGEVVSRVEKVAQSTNLLWLQVPKDGDLAILYRQGFDEAEFATALYDLLHGEGDSPERLDRFVAYTSSRGLPTKWALPTYLLMLLNPETDFFAKPRATSWFLKEIGAGFDIGTKPSGELYARLLGVVNGLRQDLEDYGPQDVLDIQSYVWVASRTKPGPKPAAGQLAEPFASMFEDWDQAWWAFDLLGSVLDHAGCKGPDDERFALTLYKNRATIHLDFGQWLLLGFGDERQAAHQTAFLLSRDSDLFAEAGGGEGFAANKEVTIGVRPTSSVRDDYEQVWPEIERAMDQSHDVFARWVGSPYRKHNRPQLYEAVADQGARERLLSEGLSVTEADPEDVDMPASDVYTHIADRGYHFPDWLVTDYVLSLATKPLVILSGISGTGKTKMAQLVAEYIAPDVMVERASDEAPTMPEGGFLHRVGASTLKWKAITVPMRAVGLFETTPPRGGSMELRIDVDGLGSYVGRLGNVGYKDASQTTWQVFWRKDLAEALGGNVAVGDYLLCEPAMDGQAQALRIRIVQSRTISEQVSSERIAFLSVRPDWTDNRALLGYYNPLTQQYQATELLRLLLRARANPDEPHLVVLDEMNLAKVEYYFSDFLSAVEADSELALHDAGEELAIGEDSVSVPERLRVPANVFFTGTVNVDETTYMFSPKVLDRANTLEFNDVDLENYGSSSAGETGFYRLRAGVSVEGLLASYRMPMPQDWRELPPEYADRLRALHGLMAEHNLHFGYRVANEIARYLNLASEFVGPDALETAYDLQVLQKVLPKLAGSRARLEAPLTALLEHLAKEDLPLSSAKVERMLKTVQSVGFVSFVE